MTRDSNKNDRLARHVRRLRLYGLALASLPLLANPPAPASDTRQVYSLESPAWLRAVGKLSVPGHKYENGRRAHHFEDCSATLVAQPRSTRADTIITAWHCLEFYQDLSKPITFTLLPGSADNIASEAYRLADGGGMHADWAILRLRRAVPTERVGPMLIHQGRADPGRPISMAGYSRDDSVGNNGEHLTFDPGCAITHQARHSSDSNCSAHKGASGGAVTQLSEGGQALICGITSQGNGAGLSTFVPVNSFRSALNQQLR
jgi:hypothetical protein